MASAAALLLLVQGSITAQTQNRVMGEVTARTDAGVILKADSGEIFAVVPAPGARIQRIRPGETDLAKAEPVELSSIAPGDRLLAVGVAAPESKTFTARLMVAMSSSEIAQKRERERAEWQRRGIGGLVEAVDKAKKEIRIRIPGLVEAQTVTVLLKEHARLRRYAPDSVRFADAKPSSLEEIQAGDQLRALGDRSEDGSRFSAEEVVTGNFRTVAGKVTAVDAAAGLLEMEELDSGKKLTAKLSADTVIRRLPQGMGIFAGGIRPGGGSPGAAAGGGPPGPPGGAGPVAGGPGFPPAGRRPDLQQMLERLPQVEAGAIQVGETVIVSSTSGKDPNVLTAITMLAGADGLIRMQQAMAARTAGRGASAAAPATANWNLGDIGSMIPMP